MLLLLMQLPILYSIIFRCDSEFERTRIRFSFIQAEESRASERLGAKQTLACC
jgi:hypothetical protein